MEVQYVASATTKTLQVFQKTGAKTGRNFKYNLAHMGEEKKK